jgi:hypothetical protein
VRSTGSASDARARQQAQWLVSAWCCSRSRSSRCATGATCVLENYRYLIAIVGVGSLLLPRLPGSASRSTAPTSTSTSADLLPAVRVRQDRDRHLPRVLPARQPPAAGDGRAAHPLADAAADEAVRPAAARLGLGDGDAPDDARDRHLADVLRRLPRAALRRHGALLVPVRRAGPVRRSAPTTSGTHVATSTHACSPGSTRFNPALYDTARAGSSYQLAQSLFAQADGGCSAPASTSRCCSCPVLPVPESDMIYAVIVNELGLVGATGCSSSTCCSSRAG